MPVDVLRCRVCESDYPALANGICVRCFGPLEPVYDWDAARRASSTRERIEAGPALALALRRPAARRPPPADAASGPGLTPLVPAPRLASALGVGEVLLKLDHREPDALVQGPRRRRRRREGARVRARDALVRPRPATSRTRSPRAPPRRACTRSSSARPGSSRRSSRATTVYGARVYGVRGSYDDCSRLVSELAGEVDWGFVNVNLRAYYAEGSKTLAFEIAEQLGWEMPDAVVAPIALGRDVHEALAGLRAVPAARAVGGDAPRLYGGQAEGCAPVAPAFAEERRVSPVRPNSIAHSLAIGNPADGDLAIATARASGGGDLRRARGRGRREHGAARRDRRASSARRAAGVAVGALRAAVAARRARRVATASSCSSPAPA